jgi:hypothetical protein
VAQVQEKDVDEVVRKVSEKEGLNAEEQLELRKKLLREIQETQGGGLPIPSDSASSLLITLKAYLFWACIIGLAIVL